MVRALREFEITNLTTLIPFHTAILQTEQWANAETCRELIEDREWLKALSGAPPEGELPEEEETVERSYTVEVSGKRFDVRVVGPPFAGGPAPAGAATGASNGASATGATRPRRSQRKSASGGGPDTLPSPLQGNMWKVLVKQGDAVEEGQLLCIIEAMKMENEITAHKSGTIVELPISEGAPIQAGAPIATIKSETAG